MNTEISLSMGAGSKATAELLETVFFEAFGRPDTLEDSAVIPFQGNLVMSTDSFVIDPIFFRDADIGKLSVVGTLNDLIVRGAKPLYLSCGFILEEGLPIEDLKTVIQSMKREIERFGVKIITADTKVVERRQEKPGLFINTTGIGVTEYDLGIHHLAAGQKLIITGNLGDHEASVYSERMQIENDIKSDVACLYEPIKCLLEAGIEIKAMRDITRGGLSTVLHEWSEGSGLGMELQESLIPVGLQTRALCRILGFDPLDLANEGKLLISVASADAERAIELLREFTETEKAAIVGEVRPQTGVFLQTPLGARRRIRMPYGESLPRIC